MNNLKKLKLFLLSMEKTNFTPQETTLIVNRLYSDIACGVNAGVNSVFVLSTEGTMADLEKSDAKPDFVYKNIKGFYEDIR